MLGRKGFLSFGLVLFCIALPAQAAKRDAFRIIEASQPVARMLLNDFSSQVRLLSKNFDENSKYAAILVPKRLLKKISHCAHEVTGHCGGFIDVTYESKATPKTRARLLRVAKGLPSIGSAKPEIVQALKTVRAQNIEDFVKTLNANFKTRNAETQEGVLAAQWIRDTWAGMAKVAKKKFDMEGIEVELVPPPRGFKQPSVRIIIPGSEPSLPVVVLGGHLDSISRRETAPGADDDASGISTLTEAFRVMITQKIKPKAAIHIFGYAAEEYGLHGSRAIAEHYRQKAISMKGVMQLDMVAYPGKSKTVTFITDYVDQNLTLWTQQVFGLYVGGDIRVARCGYACSDHASWHRYGFSTVMPAESPLSQMNPRLHTPEDLWDEQLDAEFAAQFAKLAYAFAAELSEAQHGAH
ncbi:MAG: M20/M25/M40 family metallo-hydrolase [Bdellovibrionota bacterium]